MMKVKKGDTVKLAYTGKLDNGSIFDRSKDNEPVEFTVGEGKVIPGIEKAVEGMDVGEAKSVDVKPGEAYGERDDELVKKIDRRDLPSDFAPEKGMVVTLDFQNGETVAATIADVADQTVTLDLNHPLSGRSLKFDIKIVDAKPPKVTA